MAYQKVTVSLREKINHHKNQADCLLQHAVTDSQGINAAQAGAP
jgi:hypothetical protein